MSIRLNSNSTNQTTSVANQMEKIHKKHESSSFWILFIIIGSLVVGMVSIYSDVKDLQRRSITMTNSITNDQQFVANVLGKLDQISTSLSSIKENQERIEKVQTELQNKIQEVTKDNTTSDQNLIELKAHVETVADLKEYGFTIDTDLGMYTNLTEQDMNDIIDWFNTKTDGGTPFKDNGYIFIRASEETGLSPLYIFAHASLESAYGKSALAKEKGNYFGIGAWDCDPYNKAHTMGSTMEEGIVNGAKWIADRYYNQGYTTLRKMKERGYATDPNWENQIASIANRAINQLKLQKEGMVF